MSFVDKQVEALKEQLECPIDFVGQQTADRLSQQILWASATVSFVVGFVFQSLRTTLFLFAIGLLACCAVTLPPWPMYNSHPVNWKGRAQGASTTQHAQESKKDQ